MEQQIRFHDTLLSSMVKSARHAVALDERRVFYKPALWDNLEASRGHEGLNKGDRSEKRPYQQVWFTGTHGDVGGQINDFQAARPLANSHTLDQPPPLYTVAGNLLEWRRGPGRAVDLHLSAVKRVKARRDYRPRSLKNLMPELFGGEPIGKPVPKVEGPGR